MICDLVLQEIYTWSYKNEEDTQQQLMNTTWNMAYSFYLWICLDGTVHINEHWVLEYSLYVRQT